MKLPCSHFRFRRQSLARRMLSKGILVLCLVLIVHVWGMEAFVVPTGSMAPALAGHHRVGICPRCGFPALVGRHPTDANGKGGPACYQGTTCANCGFGPLPLGHVPEATGDHILVNKNVFMFRRPRRWEIVVFRLFGKVFVKRIIGLPGEWLLVEDGDIFIDGDLARKTLEELKAVRILVFDNNYQPRPWGWGQRWEHKLPEENPSPEAPDSWTVPLAKANMTDDEEVENGSLASLLVPMDKKLGLDTLRSTHTYHWLTYRHFILDAGKARPIRDEYGYNGGCPVGEETVHDFMVECDMVVEEGAGKVALGITDGQDSVLAEIPVAQAGKIVVSRGRGQTLLPETRCPPLALVDRHLEVDRSYRVELAFVDRRWTLRIDGEDVCSPVDLAPAKGRPGVVRPFTFGAKGVKVGFSNVRLYRDIHYTQAGRQAVRGKAVRLGVDQYFVMGDNSPNSEDSRFWPRRGAVPAGNLLGKPFLVHLPSRVVTGFQFEQHYQLPDWGRLRWLR